MRKKLENNNLNIGPLHEVRERKSLGQLVFENLKQAIVQGDLLPGTWLVESQIADAQGISRTPVREAIHKLERERFIERQPRGGFIVLGLNREDIVETFGIRSVLEGYAARLAAIKHKPEELIPLDKKIEEFQKYLDKKQLAPLLKVNTEFHDLLYDLSKSPKLIHIINGLRDQIYRFRQIILKEDKVAKMSNDDHRKMLKLIRRRDADGVDKIVRDHILRGQTIVLNEIDQQGFD
jgi:DNA-binding GntR family transcriptional regulator